MPLEFNIGGRQALYFKTLISEKLLVHLNFGTPRQMGHASTPCVAVMRHDKGWVGCKYQIVHSAYRWQYFYVEPVISKGVMQLLPLLHSGLLIYFLQLSILVTPPSVQIWSAQQRGNH